jgi:hypothetical protein
MRISNCLILSITLFSMFGLAGCEAVIEDYDTDGCKPTSCEEIGDTDAQGVGCCSQDAETIFFCQGGVLQEQPCTGDRVCDYDGDLNKMVCVDE